MNKIHRVVYIHSIYTVICCSIHLLIDILGSLYFGAVVNTATVNKCIHVLS